MKCVYASSSEENDINNGILILTNCLQLYMYLHKLYLQLQNKIISDDLSTLKNKTKITLNYQVVSMA